MSTAISPRKSVGDRFDSLAAVFVSDRAVAVGRAIREAWWFLWPVFYFAVHVVLLTFVLGFSRWIALDTVREDISEAGTSHPTLLAVFDAFDGVLRAAEAVGSSGAAASYALWVAWIFAVLAVALSGVSILVSPSSNRAPRLSRSWAWFPRRAVREIFAVLIACAILARVAGEPNYLFSTKMWMNAVLLALVMWLTVFAEQRWMSTEPSYARITHLPAARAGVTFGSTARADLADDAVTASVDPEANR
ncbi:MULTISPECIES: hypothetical protein [Rhodococcus]|uniref:Transmembrane protein n=1 Tax=Rhodococcus qingshengii JCM 15477 TaxID=1303681 RepID=A0AB38RNQ2_RHOSG|nr:MULTISPECIES: hypothetical protein [Rhodococcus]UPU46239.1 hypothetical protein M0639_29775 [Rhodococcus qingshengii JCM 15477]